MSSAIPPDLQLRLVELDEELKEGEITEKGYHKRRSLLLQSVQLQSPPPHRIDQFLPSGRRPSRNSSKSPDASLRNVLAHSRTTSAGSKVHSVAEHASRPDQAATVNNHPDMSIHNEEKGVDGRNHTMTSDGNFPDFNGSVHRYSGFTSENNLPTDLSRSATAYSTQNSPATPYQLQPWDTVDASSFLPQQLPLDPRGIPDDIFDPHDPNSRMDQFETLGAVLRVRGTKISRKTAYIVLDSRGKETSSITWDKLASRVEKVAQVIRDKSGLYRGDRVALVYRDAELIEFTVAFMGCLMAGVVAVPINDFEDYNQLNFILTSTQSHLALTTDNNLKAFQRDLASQNLHWPKGTEWWKTNEFGLHVLKKKDDLPQLHVPDLAYIEFSKSPTGQTRGVVMSHRTIMHQMACLSSITASAGGHRKDTFKTSLRDRSGNLIVGKGSGEVLVTYLDPRQSIGLITSVLLGIYGGQTTVWCPTQTILTPGLFAHIITRYRASLILADYPGLKTAAFNYQTAPMQTRNYSKKASVDFSSIKLCLIDCLSVDADFHEILGDRWLRPLGNSRGRESIAPMLCLPEHGGMVISMRDDLGGEDRIGVSEKTDADVFGLAEVLLDKESLRTNEVVIVATGEEAKRRGDEPSVVRVGTFGFPIPDATLAVVDPETSMLTRPNIIGEIWVDSPSLSGGFWALPNSSQAIFHAKPIICEPGSLTPVSLEQEFLRTGLLGCMIDGRVFVLGMYEDRLRQKVEWSEKGNDIAEYRYHYTMHLVLCIMRKVPRVFDCAAFDILVNGEHLPVIVLESTAASIAPTNPSNPPRQLDPALLDAMAERSMEVLLEEHQIRVYCVMITAPNMLPRVLRNGRRDIGNMLCRKEYERGSLPCVHVKFGSQRAVQNLPVGDDLDGGIWSPMASRLREVELVEERQYSGIDIREVVIDDRTHQPLSNFTSMVDLLQWRVARQSEELSYCTVDSRSKEGKGITWKKLDLKVAAVAYYIKHKAKLKAGDRAVMIYTHSEEYIFALHACFCLGIVPIPMAPLDPNRLSEDVPALLNVVSDFSVKAILVNADVDHALKSKVIAQHLKHTSSVANIKLPPTYNTTKPPRQSQGCRDLGFTCQPEWITPGKAALVWLYWTSDQRRIAVQLGHDTMMAMCKVQKETCQMSSSRPVLGCVRSTSGLGFLHTCLMGIFVGASTYIVSPVDFAANPLILFQALARYKIKDTYATTQMLDHTIGTMQAKGFKLHELGNLMICFDGRPRTDILRNHLGTAALESTAINTIYCNAFNPMIVARSYMSLDPVELWLDTKALRKGRVILADPSQDRMALKVQDSGMVPVSTQVAIANPETCRLCHLGEYGEIWVASEACVTSFYDSNDTFDAERFVGKLADGDHRVNYVRTGDLGFLLNMSRPIGPNGAYVEMQTLFVLGGIGETFDVNGLSHFPMDIEASVEGCHRNITPGGSAIFQTGGLVIVLVEIVRKNYLASLVPVIVNAILDQHQLIVDVVAFVGRGDFPRSRLGEKQRGKILGAWVTKRLRTVAQFAIRANNDVESPLDDTPTHDDGFATIGENGMHDVHDIPVELRDTSMELERFPFVNAEEELPAATGYDDKFGDLHLGDLPEPNFDDSDSMTPIAEPVAPIELGQPVATNLPLSCNSSSLGASTDSTAEHRESGDPMARKSLEGFPIEAIEQMRLHDQEKIY